MKRRSQAHHSQDSSDNSTASIGQKTEYEDFAQFLNRHGLRSTYRVLWLAEVLAAAELEAWVGSAVLAGRRGRLHRQRIVHALVINAVEEAHLSHARHAQISTNK